MQENIAVIDLGTNTFHLLIVKQVAEGFEPVYRERRFIKLAEAGIETIGESAYDRALQAMLAFHQILQREQVQKIQAFGTAALRTASNGPAFIKEVHDRTGIRIQMIDGNREAGLIHKGVQLAVPFDRQYKLIMDIGGGSVEFIIANSKEVVWAQSFPIGVAVLQKGYHRQDPISDEEKKALRQFLQTTLAPLAKALEKYPCEDLVGASGTFDVLEHMLVEERPGPHHAYVSVESAKNTMKKIQNSSLAERLATPKLPPERADLIVVALILIQKVLNLGDIQRIIISAYAMKEGMIAEIIEAE